MYNSHSEKKAARSISSVSGLLFIIFSFVFLSVSFGYMLKTTEDFSLFIFDRSYFFDKISQPGGLIIYLASFFTQFLYHPWLGAAIITLILLLIQRLAYKSFDFNQKYLLLSYIPSFLLLVIITSVGSSLYLMNHVESVFAYMLQILIILFSYYLFKDMDESSQGLITVFWLVPLLYFALSGSAVIYFFGLILLCRTFAVSYRNKFLTYLACIVMYALSYLLAKFVVYTHFADNQVLFGIYPIIPTQNSGEELLPHLFLVAYFIYVAIEQRFIPLSGRIRSSARWSYTNLIWFILFCAGTATLANTNDCFRHEMVIDQAIQRRNYEEALKVGKDVQHPTRVMTVLRNYALVLSGKAGEKMFEYPQDFKTDGLFLDYNKDGLLFPVGPMIYFNLGAKHLATEWADNNYKRRSNSFRVLNNYALIATANGHLNAAKDIADVLNETLYHKEFGNKLAELSSDNSQINNDSVLGGIKKRLSDNYYKFPSKGEYTEFICDFYRKNIDNEVAFDYYMMAALLNKNIPKLSWGINLYYKLHNKLNLPKHYAEAAALCNYVNKESLFVPPSVQQKFNEFLKLQKEHKNKENEKNIMRQQYGDTFWWYFMYK